MARAKISGKRLFVLDTNVLMHDPTALFRFAEHDVYIPMIVLEELDAGKKGTSETARNVRQVSRFLDDLMGQLKGADIAAGIPLTTIPMGGELCKNGGGRLYFQTKEMEHVLPESLPGSKADNTILNVAMAQSRSNPSVRVTLVSKDINLRIKATTLAIHAEDYFNDRVLDEIEQLHTGMFQLPDNFWDKHSKQMDSWQEKGRTFYRISGPLIQQWFPNTCVYKEDDEFEAIVRKVDGKHAILETATDYRNKSHNVWGIVARNREQSFALNLLMDPEIDFISLQGSAGTGKTLLTLAAALEQTIERGHYKEVLVTRVTVPVGEDIGFLPGTEEEKMTPWMGALMDNLEVLAPSDEQSDWGQAATQDVLKRWVKVRSLNFMRGRTFLNKFVILDEAQNLTPKQMKTLVTRAGPGTKMVCLGNVAQIDTPYLTETSSGLTYVVDRFKDWEHSGHITLRRGERSRLADHASLIL
ncbi:MAG: PhoH family protein [Pseudomonadota bacterium]